MAKTLRTFKVRVDVYDTVVRVLRDVDKMVRYAVREGAPPEFMEDFDSSCEARAYHLTNHDGVLRYGLYLRDSPPAPGTVAHECFHIARYILDDRGVSEDGDAQEATAYLLGHLVTSIYARFGAEAEHTA